MKRRGIGRRPAAKAAEQATDARPPDQLGREPRVEGRQRHGGITEHLDRDPAGAQQDQRSEDGVAPEPEDQFLSLGSPHHRLQGEAVDPRVGRPGPHPFGDRPGGRPGRLRRGDVEDDRAEIGLVADVARQELDRDPTAVGEHRRRLRAHRVGVAATERGGEGMP
ncbi:MAG: hypothetical protein U1E59_03320 [Amaricoccus sp.]